MRKLIRNRPSAATVLSLIALFAALGGTSYAAATISGKMVQNGTLTGVDVKNRSLSGVDQKNNSLGGTQIAESKLGKVPSAAKAGQADKASQADNATQAQKALSADQATKASSADAVGPNGVNSAAIQNGAVTGGKFGTVTRRSDEVTIASGQSENEAVSCAAGERAIGGGTYWNDVVFSNANSAQLHVVYSGPNGSTGNGWQARAYNNSGDNDAKLEVYVICVN